jgi:hypothetical protein
VYVHNITYRNPPGRKLFAWQILFPDMVTPAICHWHFLSPDLEPGHNPYLRKNCWHWCSNACSKYQIMVPGEKAAVLGAPNQLCYLVSFFALFATNFVHNVAAAVSYDRKELLDIRTAITHLKLDKI